MSLHLTHHIRAMFAAHRKQEAYPHFPSREWLEAAKRLVDTFATLSTGMQEMGRRMGKSLLGCHWIRVHPDGRDMGHIAAMQYRSVKTFEWMHGDKNFCNDMLSVLPKDSYILARNHPRSEQKGDLFANPVATGVRHANEWADDVRNGRCFLPTDRTFFLPVNEPDATTGDRNAIDQYTVAFLDRLRAHGLRGGAFNFSTGHPRTVDGTPNTPPDYTFFERSRQAIVRGHHIAVLHIYGTAAQPCVPGHYDRLKSCTWRDVEWIVGECAIDEHVVGGGPHNGYQVPFAGRLHDYCPWLDTLIMGINDKRIHSYQVFTYDFSHPWSSFDTRPIRDALETYAWKHTAAIPIPPDPTPQPPDPTPPQPPSQQGKLLWPVRGPVTQRWGERADFYQQKLGIPYHNGTDVGTPVGTPVIASADGVVKWVDTDATGYGLYCRLYLPAFRVHLFVAHLDRVMVRAGDMVKSGQVIAYTGNSGLSSGPHCHIECRLGTENSYAMATYGHTNGRCDPQAAFWLLGGTQEPMAGPGQ